MTQPTLKQRAEGAIMGALIGDALALGPHWYYNLDEQYAAYGHWIDDYTTPQAGRYHEGLKAGDSSQAGVILQLMLRSLIERGEYDEADFCQRLDNDLFPLLDGGPMSGPGGYTSQSIRWVYQRRQQGVAWDAVAGPADTTEAAERVLAIAVRYARDPKALMVAVDANTVLTQNAPTVAAMTCAYALILGQLVNGAALDENLSGALMALAQSGDLPFHSIIGSGNAVPQQNIPHKAGQFASPDALLTASFIAQAAEQRLIEPAWKASLVYGMPCAVYHQFPAAYYLAARFQKDVESALLHAVNGGGQNQARAILTGALSGAIGGIDAFPDYLIKGLNKSDEYLALAAKLAEAV